LTSAFRTVALPIILVGVLIALVIATIGNLSLEPPAPIENLTIERIVLEPGLITAHLRNSGPTTLTIAQVSVNDSIWPATASPSNEIPRLGTATMTLRYPWVQGEAYEVVFFTTNALAFRGSIAVAFATPQPSAETLGRFTLIGVYVGVLPIAIGLMWLPLLRRAGRHGMLFLLTFTVGVLLVLGIDTLTEALEQASRVPGAFQGVLLVGIGALGTVLVLASIGAHKAEGLRLAYLIALGIGLHNLGEGLAIGAAYSVGEFALGLFLIVGFILQNVTEGVALLVPILRDRVRLQHLLTLLAVAGLPTVFGTWVGGFSPSVTWATLFLAIGVGAIGQVLYEVSRLALRELSRVQAPGVALAGALSGMLLLYATGLLLK
jgi:ZIP family zinc transporter